MGMMTIRAGRDSANFFFPKLPLDDLDMDFFDPGVTLRAGCGNVPSRDSGGGIRVGEDEMVPVAIVTGGCNGQASLEQALAVDALRIVGQDIFLWNVVDTGYRCSFTMARSTKHGDIHFVGFRAEIRRGKNIVLAVALFAGGSIRSASFEGLAVYSGGEIILRLGVAGPAAHRGKLLRMGKFFYSRILVTSRALELPMDRWGQRPGFDE